MESNSEPHDDLSLEALIEHLKTELPKDIQKKIKKLNNN
jgi:hypothetical protein